MGTGISVEGLTKSFGSQRIWEDVTMDIRRQARVRENLHLLPKNAQAAILDSLEGTAAVPGARVRRRQHIRSPSRG